MMRSPGTRRILKLFTVLCCIIAVYMLVNQLLLPDYYEKKAAEQVEKLVKAVRIDTFSYPLPEEIPDRVYFASEIFILADWDREQREKIERALGTEAPPARLPGGVFAPPTMEYYLWQAKQKERPKREEQLREAVEQGLNALYEQAGKYAPVQKVALLKYYKRSGLEMLCQVLDLIRKIADSNAYDPALFKLLADSVRYGIGDRCVPADLLYGFWPEGFRQCCMAYLAEQIQQAGKENLDDLKTALVQAEAFEKRYGTSAEFCDYGRQVLANLEKEKQADDLRAADEAFRAKPNLPEVGMRYDKAQDTKLGAPTRIDKREYYSEASRSSYYNGNMYWEENGRQIFRAEFKYSEITRVWDTRKKSSGSRKNYRYGSGSSGKSDVYDVYDFDDPDEFADEWADEFGDGDYDGGWDDAWDYWQDAH